MTTITCNTVLVCLTLDYFHSSSILYTAFVDPSLKFLVEINNPENRKTTSHAIVNYFSLTSNGAIESAPSEKHPTD